MFKSKSPEQPAEYTISQLPHVGAKHKRYFSAHHYLHHQ
jgi:hypothetical protein